MAVKVKERKGKWWVFIDHKGNRKAKCVGDRRSAEIVAEKIRAKLTLGDFGIDAGDKERHPFNVYFPGWLETYVRAHCKPATFVGYEVAYRRHLLPRFGDTDIREIRREDVKRLAYEMLAQKRTRSTVKATLAPLREMFNHALEDGHVSANPAARVLKRSRIEAGAKRAADFLTRDELEQFLGICREHFPHAYPFLLLLARTGMRIGEATALQWSDIDFAHRFAEVRRAFSQGHLGTPKSGKARRVDLSRHLVETLQALRIERKKQALRGTWREVPAWVFVSEAGTPIDVDNFRRRIWPRIFSKAGLRQVRLHDLRHTYASLLIAQDESLAYIRDQLGHSSIQVTVDVYGHLVPGGNKAAVDRLDEPRAARPSATYPQPLGAGGEVKEG